MEINNTIYIYGMSGHGKVVADIALANGYVISGWIDDDPQKEAISWEKFNQSIPKGTAIALGIGDNLIRKSVFQKVLTAGYTLPSLIHPSAIIAPSVSLGNSTVIMPLCVINADATIGTGTIINTASIIEHDCKVGNFVHISPNVALGGNVQIEDLTHIGIGSCIIQNIRVGENSVIGAGSTVIQAIPSNVTAVGNPSRVITFMDKKEN